MALRSRKLSRDEDAKTIDISAGMQGSLVFKDPVDLKINGDFSGSLVTKGMLTIGSNAVVEANIVGDNIIISGKVTGDITANQMLTIMETASLRGDISTPKLNIVEGAVFHGNCQMIDDLLNVDQVAKYLEISINEIEQLANSGKIPGSKSNGEWRFDRIKIGEWAATTKVD